MDDDFDTIVGKTIEQFIEDQQVLLKLFLEWWKNQALKDEEGFPLELATSDTSLWLEMFNSFEPDEKAILEYKELHPKISAQYTLKELIANRERLEKKRDELLKVAESLDAEKAQFEKDAYALAGYISSSPQVPPDSIKEIIKRIMLKLSYGG